MATSCQSMERLDPPCDYPGICADSLRSDMARVVEPRGRHFDLRIPLAQHTDICSAQTDERWETRAILGEKIWLDRDVTAIRDDHLRAVRWIATGSSLCSVPLIIGLVWLDPWATAFGAAGMFFGQAWLLDRFAWLYETKRSCSSDVGRHG